MMNTAFDPAAIAADAVCWPSWAVLAVEGHGCDRVFTEAAGSLRVQITVTGPGGHSWWDRGRPSAERIRADSIVTGARQLRAVLQEVLELTPRAAKN
jgi:hypothetical protein